MCNWVFLFVILCAIGGFVWVCWILNEILHAIRSYIVARATIETENCTTCFGGKYIELSVSCVVSTLEYFRLDVT